MGSQALSSEYCRIQSQMSSVSTSCQKTEMSHRKLSSTGLTFDMTSLKESLALAEMKAAAASREIKQKLRRLSSGSDNNYVPPKQLLLYLVRMGSFTSKPKVSSEENPDADLEFPPTSSEELLARCKIELKSFPKKIERSWKKQDVGGDGESSTIRVVQWNQLSQ